MSKVHLEVTMMKRIGELKAENARLKAEVERLNAFTTRTIIPNEILQAEVERLTDAITRGASVPDAYPVSDDQS